MIRTFGFVFQAMTYDEFLESLLVGEIPLHIKGGTLPDELKDQPELHFTMDAGIKKKKQDKYDIPETTGQQDEIVYKLTKSSLYALYGMLIVKGE